MSVTTERLTVEEYLARDFPPKTQLIHGEVVMNAPTKRHERIAFRIAYLLTDWIEHGSGSGEAGIGMEWTVGDRDAFIPDAWWVSEAHRPSPQGPRVHAFPDLVVEVRSASTWRYDLGPKRASYEAAGVLELWLVDIESDTVIVNRRSAADAPEFDVLTEVGRDAELSSPLLPGFELRLDELFDR